MPLRGKGTGKGAEGTKATPLRSGTVGVNVALMVGAMYNPAASAASPAWLELRQNNVCEVVQDEYCLGRFGFAIKPDGSFALGPSGSGRQVEGRIKRAELRRLNTLIASTAATIAAGQTQCEPSGPVGVRDRFDIAFGTGPPVRLYDLGGQVRTLCVSGRRNRAVKLHDYLRLLMTRYYRLPFS
jgi:hypothetical protein